MKDKDIKKGIIWSLFTDPISGNSLLHTTKKFPIHWCIHARMRSCFWDRWYMVFDLPQCNIYEVPLYFFESSIVSFSLVRTQITLTSMSSRVEGEALHRIDLGLVGWYHNMRGDIKHENFFLMLFHQL